ncbi:MAG: hypothetical protein WEA09_01365 [Gemmatimonadota bacterium]
MPYFKELKERRIVQILFSYLAAGFLVLEVFDQLADRGIVPELAYQVALLWYLLGIVAALIIGWYHGEKGEQKAPVREIVMLTVLAIVTLGLTGRSVAGFMGERAARVAAAETSLDLTRVAVTYFEDLSPSGELQFLADGLTESLMEELRTVRSLEVVSRNGVGAYRDSDAPPDSIAQILQAGTLVLGTVEQVGDRIRVGLRLLDGQSGATMERAGLEGSATDLLTLRQEIAGEAAIMLRGWLGTEVRLRETENQTSDMAAWAMLQRAEKSRKDALTAARDGEVDEALRLLREAEGLAGQAAALDPAWPQPLVLRATIQYRLSRLAQSREEMVRHMESGLQSAQSALALAPTHPEALAVRGTLRYWRFLQRLDPDPGLQETLVAEAQRDLERAVELAPGLADAHQVLSHVYYRDNRAQAVLAARTAYQEDAYLEVADEILARLFNGNYDLEEFSQARRWCEEGRRRFPGQARFTECRLLLMTTPELEADPEEAQSLVMALERLLPEHGGALRMGYAQLMEAGVLARAGRLESADSVMRRVRESVSPPEDPQRELLQFEAAMRTLMGDHDQAIALLQRYSATNPEASFEHHWWWRDLRGRPDLPRPAAH